jgi:hypothetical protein
MGVDPVGQRLRPNRLGEGEARCPQHGDEDLRHADLAGEPIDDDRNAVTGVIDEQPLAGGVRLAASSPTVSFRRIDKARRTRVAVAARVRGDVFVPEDQQGDVLALQFVMRAGPVWFLDLPMAAFAASAGVERRLQRLVVYLLWKGPGQARAVHPLQRLPHRRARQVKPAGYLVRRYRRRRGRGFVATASLVKQGCVPCSRCDRIAW